jgi:hypothetical protein
VSRVARIWRREGLKVPGRQPKRRRLWLTDGSCIRLRPERPNHVWAYDFVADRTSDGKGYRMLNIVDEYTRECLAIKVARKLNSMDVIETLADLFLLRGVRLVCPLDDKFETEALASSFSEAEQWLLNIKSPSAPCQPLPAASPPPARAARTWSRPTARPTSSCGVGTSQP